MLIRKRACAPANHGNQPALVSTYRLLAQYIIRSVVDYGVHALTSAPTQYRLSINSRSTGALIRADRAVFADSSEHLTATIATQSARPALTFDPLPIIVQSSWRRASDRLSPLALGSAGPRPWGPRCRSPVADWPASADRTPPIVGRAMSSGEHRRASPAGCNISGGHLPRIAKYLSSNYSITGLLVRSSSHNSAIFAPATTIIHGGVRA